MDWQAEIGDEVSIESHRLGGGRKKGVIREVHATPGHEYYLVQWEDGHTSVFHPGPDAVLIPKKPKKTRRKAIPARAPGGSASVAAPAAPEVRPERRPRPQTTVAAGDRLVIKGHRLGERDRDAEILEVLGDASTRRYRVRWSDTGREGLLFPGTDAVIEHFPRRRRRSPSSKA